MKVFMAVLAIVLCLPLQALADGEWLLTEKGPQVLMLTGPTHRGSGGTGFLLNTPLGVVTITNSHICEDIEENGVLAARPQGTPQIYYIKEVAHRNDGTDLCILKGIKGYRGLTLAREFKVTSKLYSLGYPYLHPLKLSAGYALGRALMRLDDYHKTEPFTCSGLFKQLSVTAGIMGPAFFCMELFDSYESTLDTRPGNSGSPVLNSDGEVVGVIFATDVRNWDGSFIPLDRLTDFIGALTGAELKALRQ